MTEGDVVIVNSVTLNVYVLLGFLLFPSMLHFEWEHESQDRSLCGHVADISGEEGHCACWNTVYAIVCFHTRVPNIVMCPPHLYFFFLLIINTRKAVIVSVLAGPWPDLTSVTVSSVPIRHAASLGVILLGRSVYSALMPSPSPPRTPPPGPPRTSASHAPTHTWVWFLLLSSPPPKCTVFMVFTRVLLSSGPEQSHPLSSLSGFSHLHHGAREDSWCLTLCMCPDGTHLHARHPPGQTGSDTSHSISFPWFSDFLEAMRLYMVTFDWQGPGLLFAIMAQTRPALL